MGGLESSMRRVERKTERLKLKKRNFKNCRTASPDSLLSGASEPLSDATFSRVR